MDTLCTIMGMLFACGLVAVAGIIILEAKDDKPEEKRIYQQCNPTPWPPISKEQIN